MNNLYVINNILSDFTPGMAVISAPSLERCRELFIEKFSRKANEFDSAIEDNDYELIENVNRPEGIISYVYGGG